MDRSVKPVEKKYFLTNVRLFIGARKKILDEFKCKIFPIKNVDKITIFAPAPEHEPKSTLRGCNWLNG